MRRFAGPLVSSAMSVTSHLPSYLPLRSLLLLGLLASTASCTDDPSAFAGTWTYNPGSAGTVVCATGTNTLDIGGNAEFRPGTDTDLVVIDDQGCNIKLNATGNHADAVPGQSCTTTQDGLNLVITFNNGSYTASNGLLSFSAAGTVNVTGPAGTATCTMSFSATLHKVSN